MRRDYGRHPSRLTQKKPSGTRLGSDIHAVSTVGSQRPDSLWVYPLRYCLRHSLYNLRIYFTIVYRVCQVFYEKRAEIAPKEARRHRGFSLCRLYFCKVKLTFCRFLFPRYHRAEASIPTLKRELFRTSFLPQFCSRKAVMRGTVLTFRRREPCPSALPR